MSKPESATILAVVVLYKRRPEESSAYLAFRTLLGETKFRARIDLMLCDNSPVAQPPPAGFQGMYLSDISNPGLAKHYNYALKIANERGIPWLMLFDHDTVPTQEYFDESLTQIDALSQQEDKDIVAIVPRLHDGKKLCSPHLRPKWSHKPLPSSQHGKSESIIFAFNSGAILRVEALVRAGGFALEFPIEFLDYATFGELQKDGHRVHILKSILHHDLAISGGRTGISVGRYRNVLHGELNFHNKYGTRADRFYLRVRHLRNTARFLIKDRRPRLAVMAFRAAFGFYR